MLFFKKKINTNLFLIISSKFFFFSIKNLLNSYKFFFKYYVKSNETMYNFIKPVYMFNFDVKDAISLVFNLKKFRKLIILKLMLSLNSNIFFIKKNIILLGDSCWFIAIKKVFWKFYLDFCIFFYLHSLKDLIILSKGRQFIVIGSSKVLVNNFIYEFKNVFIKRLQRYKTSVNYIVEAQFNNYLVKDIH